MYVYKEIRSLHVKWMICRDMFKTCPPLPQR